MTNSRILDVPGIKNLRDMGGYQASEGRKIKWGTLYRSGHYAELSPEGHNSLHQRGITSVVDFRSLSEKERQPATWPAEWRPTYHDNPIGGNAAAWVKELYDKLSTAPFPAQELRDQFILAFETIPIANVSGLKKLFDVLIDNGESGATLFHCTAGKDRTGIAGALVMRALGVNEEDIYEDFLLTNEAVDLAATSAHYAVLMSKRAGRTIAPDAVHPLVGVEPDFLKAAFGAMQKEYGSIDSYLTNGMGLTPERRKKLQTHLLED